MSEILMKPLTDRGVAYLLFDSPNRSVNVLSQTAMVELERAVDEISRNRDVRALVIGSAKEGTFIAGADVNAIGALTDATAAREASRRGQAIYGKIAALPIPTVAAINGICLGGGTELALACRYRIAADDERVSIGLPEVNLGILPAWGGCTRLPRLIGIEAALPMILTGAPATARRALKIGLVDALAAPAGLLHAAAQLAIEGMPPRRLRRSFLVGLPGGPALIFRTAKKRVLAKTHGQYPAPIEALDVVRRGFASTEAESLEMEGEAFARLVTGDVARRLVGLFFQMESNKRSVEEPASPTKRGAVVGAGVMGAGIATLLVRKGIPVRLRDVAHDRVGAGLARIREAIDERRRKGDLTDAAARSRRALASGTVDWIGFGNVDFAIEAALEDLAIKRAIVKDLEACLPPSAIIATNTSSLSVAAIAEGASRPENIVGLHFFNPVDKMPLVEVVLAPRTSNEAATKAFALAKRLGKTPIPVRDSPGFLVNRLLFAYVGEAIAMYEEGTTASEIDAAMQGYGWAMGPFRMLDEVGLDVALAVARILAKAFPATAGSPRLIEAMVQAGKLGKKSRGGFYGRNRKEDASVRGLASSSRESAGTVSREEIVERLTLPLLNEAARALEEGVVNSASRIDLAMVLGAGFPPFRGGPMALADDWGAAAVVEKLRARAERIGTRFHPAALLVRMATLWERFHGGGTQSHGAPATAG
ncbi:MAG: enoyl-CoA hydratase/isomerase family protein [Planctomycetes bacterium]|nr:enoyl-CoA hydratase/isomerase family protein [Planctomycetota bacterium]MBI3844089.1 enoyl-CoA hydratase/isomerase family protein [Planctomycetota bacterium]